ncbi:hypothetical protein ACFQ1E_11615 [Sphingomonas canadensis]|uniref:Circumsporozoite protein n=1 Tax=Sphingomonas canadensis TaxID=1219257 RepID=A0ABW3H6H7_9SPHN|nr:hypothetical protein [Sphingomonas canadensis]MCW3836877.1 hypothetical protein [Sphingomonas canadensis]
MKKVLTVAAAAGLMTLAACTPAATNNTTEANTVEANVSDYDNGADVMAENVGAPVENVTGNAM